MPGAAHLSGEAVGLKHPAHPRALPCSVEGHRPRAAGSPAVPGSSLSSLLSGTPRVKAVKSSEHVSEGEMAVLACKSESLPPVTDWVWYKITDSGDQVRSQGGRGSRAQPSGPGEGPGPGVPGSAHRTGGGA